MLHIRYIKPWFRDRLRGVAWRRNITQKPCYALDLFISLFLARKSPPPPVGQGLFIREVSRSHITKRHSRQDSPGRVISSSQRPLPNNTQQQINIHAPGGIRTHNLSRRAAAELSLRPRGHWDRPGFVTVSKYHSCIFRFIFREKYRWKTCILRPLLSLLGVEFATIYVQSPSALHRWCNSHANLLYSLPNYQT